MDPLIGASLIGGGAGLIGSGLTSGLGFHSANQAYQNQKNLARFTAIHGPSMQMKGLRRAGLNPILAAGGKLGVGGVSVPSVAPARVGDAASGLAANVSAATKAAISPAERKLKRAQEGAANAQDAMLRASNLNIREDATNKRFIRQYIRAQTARELQSARVTALEGDRLESRNVSAAVDARLDSSDYEYYRRMIERGASTAGGVLDTFNPTRMLREGLFGRDGQTRRERTIRYNRDGDYDGHTERETRTRRNRRGRRN